MWTETKDWLKDARLVARIQECFGVRIHYMKKCRQQHDSTTEEDALECKSDRVSPKCENDTSDTTLYEKKEANGYNLVKRKVDATSESNDVSSEILGSYPAGQNPNYSITNYFWYYLFFFGTELGDEVFYSTFIPFWFWNIDGAVGRRVVLVWSIIMSTGQALKDIICWPRPECPPAARLQSKWSQEYGMPSTHAMIGVSIPFSVVLYTMNRYVYPFTIGWTIACLWCALVSMSRLYLGMHSALDILAGLTLAIFLMIPLVPLIDLTDYYIVSNVWALFILVAISIATVIYYPTSKKWTPTRGDTAMVVSVTAGVHVGAWLNFQAGIMSPPSIPLPYHIIWPTYFQLGTIVLRTILGFCSVIATRVICKPLVYMTMCAILNVDSKELMKSKDYATNKNKVLVDLVHKYITCFVIGFNMLKAYNTISTQYLVRYILKSFMVDPNSLQYSEYVIGPPTGTTYKFTAGSTFVISCSYFSCTYY